MKGLINIQNEDSKCFKRCLDRYLNPEEKNPAIIRNIVIEFSKQLDFKNIKFPVQKERLEKF